MARPRLFPVNEALNLNIYLHKEQFDKLRTMAHRRGASLAAVVRQLIDETPLPRDETQT